MESWEKDELHEQISQGVYLLRLLLDNSDDCTIRDICEAHIQDKKAYLPIDYSPPNEEKGFDIATVDGGGGYDGSRLDGDETKLGY